MVPMPCMRPNLPNQLKLRLPPPRQHRRLLHPQRLRPLLLPNNFFGMTLKATALAVAFFLGATGSAPVLSQGHSILPRMIALTLQIELL